MTNVARISEEASLSEIADLMENDEVEAVVIIKNEASVIIPVGVITDRDRVMQLCAAQDNPKAVYLKDLMNF